MNRGILMITLGLTLLSSQLCPVTYEADARFSTPITQPVGATRCFRNIELSQGIATMKQQIGADLTRVSQFLLGKARTSPGCKAELVQALIRAMEASKNKTDQIEEYYLWQHGASTLADLKAIEALDLLVYKIDLTDGWSTSINENHTPALVAILKIGLPAIPKLEIALKNDSVPHRRKFAAFAIAYIGGVQARRALTNALPGETDPCVKTFLQLSLQAFDNKAKPNHISSELNGKWLDAFYCL